MITIPLYIILFIYLAYLAVVGVFLYVHLSHLFHNGALTFVSFSITIIIFALAATTLFFTFAYFSNIDWQQPLTLWNNNWITNTLNPSSF
jgi:hypothetical protein